MKKNRSFLSKALLPLAIVLASGAGTIPARETQPGNGQATIQQNTNPNKQTPVQSQVTIQRQYTDPRHLPLAGKRKKKSLFGGEMSRHKAKMKCKKYCRKSK